MNLIDSYIIEKSTETKILEIDRWEGIIRLLKSQYSKTFWVIDSVFRNNSVFDTIENKLFLQGGEQSKSFDGLTSLLEKLNAARMDKKSILIALGGGSISDITGFAASVYLRGIAYAAVPSTLLNMVDAAIGGKNGINFLHTKNQIGTIYQPDYIFHFHPIFESLSPKDLADGFAEIIKYGLIGNPSLFDNLSEENFHTLTSNKEKFIEIINRCIIQKISIIKQDPYDKGIRRTLNFGHTLGHAIESLYSLSHGQSVGLGMIFSAKLSELYYGMNHRISEKIKTLLSQYTLPISITNFDGKELMKKIYSDKKIESEFIHFVTLKEIGFSHLEILKLSELESFILRAEREKMDIRINHSPNLKGEIVVPPSKSYAQRAMAATLLVKKTHIRNYGNSDDEQAALEIIKTTGAKIQNPGKGEYIIENQFDFNTAVHLNCGESGLCARLFAGFMMLNKAQTIISGKGTLLSRPMDNILDVYHQLGISYTSQNGKLSLTISGNQVFKNISIDGSLSSQFITGLIYYMLGLKHSEPLKIEIIEPTSIPYIEMTIDLLNKIGARIDFSHHTITVFPCTLPDDVSIVVESDWSSAANWAVAAAIGGDIRLKGLNSHSLQADRKIIDVLSQYGADVQMTDNHIDIRKNRHSNFEYDAENTPDLIPILSVLAIFACGESTIYGIKRLEYKESNRLECTEKALKMIKIEYKILGNCIKINGKSDNNFKSYVFDNLIFNSYSDHRIAMSVSILALFLRGAEVKGIESIQKSYPEFYRDLLNLGGSIS